MKILNVVLSVLILVLAIASAVFSYLLFEKREQMASGYEKMAASISKVAQQIDQNTGSNYAADLSAAKLDHREFSKLSGNLSKFEGAVSKTLAERKAMAVAIREMAAGVVGADNLPAEGEFASSAAYADSMSKAKQEVLAYKARQDALAKELIKTAQKLDLKITLRDITGGNTATAIGQIDRAVKNSLDKIRQGETVLAQINAAAGGEKVDFSKVDAYQYKDRVAQVAAVVDAFKDKYDDMNGQITLKEKQIGELQADIAKKNGEIAAAKVEQDNLNVEIVRLKTVINPDDPAAVPDLWADGSVEVRKATQGTVIEINDKFGFIVLNLGKNTRVDQQIGKDKVTPINPEIKEGMTLAVARTLDKDTTEYVGRVKLFRVDDDCAFAQLENTTDNDIKVGDVVYFSDVDIAKAVGK